MPDDQAKQGEEKKEDLSKPAFEQMSSLVPQRALAIPEEDDLVVGNGGESLDDRIENAPKISDAQAVLRFLTPDFGKKLKWLNPLLAGRVYPEYYIYLKDILVKSLIRSYDMTVPEAIIIADVAVGIPFDGEGRIDAIAVMGKAADVEETKEKNKMGLP